MNDIIYNAIDTGILAGLVVYIIQLKNSCKTTKKKHKNRIKSLEIKINKIIEDNNKIGFK